MDSLSTKEAKVPATILAIGTANPVNCYYQDDYPDFLFKITGMEHETKLKDKFKRICEKSMVKKRYMGITEESLKANPNICAYKAPSFDARQALLIHEVPKLGQQAALKAIEEWGHPISSLTHLVFCTSSCVDMPGADFRLIKLLGLNESIHRVMIYFQGCFAGGTVLRIAKDIAENNFGARVLVVCSEITTMFFHQPCVDTHFDVLVGQALFSDGAAAMIVGANPDPQSEPQLFDIMSVGQTIIPNSEHGVVAHLREMGFDYYLSSETPKLVGGKIKQVMAKAIESIGVDVDLNSLFYSIHPGGPAILDKVEEQLGLDEGRLRATRSVLREFGNMGAPSVLFILDELRKKSFEERKATTGEGLEWGVLVGIGPGLTVETVMLRSAPITTI